MNLTGDNRIDAEHCKVHCGNSQGRPIRGQYAMTLAERHTLTRHIECIEATQHLRSVDTIRYSLVISTETAEQTSTMPYAKKTTE